MNPARDDPNPQAAPLQAELAAVKRREAEFRAEKVKELLERNQRIASLEAELEAANQRLGERNTYVHVLHGERTALIRRQQESFADLEKLTRMLEAAREASAALEAELGRMRRSWTWRLSGPLRALGRRFAAPAPAPSPARAQVEGGLFTYYLHTSPFRIYREPSFTLRGWAWPQDGRAVTAVRVNLSGRVFSGRHGLEEPEVIARYGPQPANPRPGFEIAFDTPPGWHALSLEAQIEGAEWRWIMRTSIWSEPDRP